MAKTYAEFQQQSASEKIGLVQVDAAKRLMGWTLLAGTTYQLASFDPSVIVALEQDGQALAAGTSSTTLNAGEYFHDRQARVLYVRTTDDTHPNGKFLALTFRLFFAGPGSVIAPHDLATGYDVEWLPLLKDTSEFGVEQELGLAIEGGGSVTFHNDSEFWRDKFDKLYFENQMARIYSWSRSLPISEAKLIYRGFIQNKSYTPSSVGFGLRDPLVSLRAPVPLADLIDVPSARVPPNMARAKQRRLYGYVKGHRPVNIDQVLDGYPLTGTFAIATGATTLTGTGTAFRAQLSEGDEITLAGDDIAVTVQTITNDFQATVSEPYPYPSRTGKAATINPSHPKRWMNRRFLVAGHALAEPLTTVTSALSTSIIFVSDTTGFQPGDDVYIGSEVSRVAGVTGLALRLAFALAATPASGIVVRRPAISAVYLDDRRLTWPRDYTYNPTTALLTLTGTAEFNIAPVRALKGTIIFNQGQYTITGSGTNFQEQLLPGDWIKGTGQGDWFEVMAVANETQATLRTPSTYTGTMNISALARSPAVYDEGRSVLSCDTLGATENGLTGGVPIQTAPQIARDLLELAGASEYLELDSFSLGAQLTDQKLGLAIPTKLNETKAPMVRDIVNRVCQSVLASVVLSEDFLLEYCIIDPSRRAGDLTLAEDAILSFSIKSDSSAIARLARIEYSPREYDPASAGEHILTVTSTGESATYLAKTAKEFTQATLLVNLIDALHLANRWVFLLEYATSTLSFQAKLQAARLQVRDRVTIQHEKLYERVGLRLRRKTAAVKAAHRTITNSSVELDDLANAFSRCSTITENDAREWDEATDDERTIHGYITDNHGMMNNNADTHGINGQW